MLPFVRMVLKAPTKASATPLSSGLDIVRKTPGQHEIATVQITAIDQAVGMVWLVAHPLGDVAET
jgi:hypothetical protein